MLVRKEASDIKRGISFYTVFRLFYRVNVGCQENKKNHKLSSEG